MACAAGLIDAGIGVGDRVGLLGENSIEWLIADMAILAAGAINVPPHSPLAARQVQFQFADAGIGWLFVSTAEQLAKLEQIRSELPHVRGVVVLDPTGIESDRILAENVVTWDYFLGRGRQLLPKLTAELMRREENIGPDTLATIMYTSGTTGNPKGVMLTHGNLLSNAESAADVGNFPPDAVALNWLPFSHIYARLVDHYQTTYIGALVCLARSVDTLVEDLLEVRPTHMSSVPRFYEKLLAAVASDDPEVTAKRLRDIFGPRAIWIGSGGAPLPQPICEIYLAAGVPLYQGYGLTETSPVISFNRPGHNKPGTVGLPIPGVDVSLGPDGEILTRGPHVMKGYWNNVKETEEVMTDGWLHTGDLGEIDAEGFLKITGRKKELMVLSNGKKVVPSYLEGLLLADECIDQAVVSGEGRNFLTALIVPHWQNLRRSFNAKQASLDHQPDESLANCPEVHSFLQERIECAMKDVAGWEHVRKFVILPRPLSVAAEELTVSLKLRRNFVLAKYADQLEALYRE
jgi:long-chain acyl-CoA synthetase